MAVLPGLAELWCPHERQTTRRKTQLANLRGTSCWAHIRSSWDGLRNFVKSDTSPAPEAGSVPNGPRQWNRSGTNKDKSDVPDTAPPGPRAKTSPGWARHALTLLILVVTASGANAQDSTAAFAGFAYSGDAASINQRFRYSTEHVSGLERRGTRITAGSRTSSPRLPLRTSPWSCANSTG